MTMFFYNLETNQCDCFVYGGCEPDDGQPQLVFKNLEECQHTCKPSNLQKGPTCDIVFRKEESFRLFTSAATTTSRPRPNLDLSHFNDDSLLGLFANI
ncbi:Kunitz-type serine protease inhibitor 3-like [Homarus americanus]|uniref:Kunitz-type serine protease inhibitor 3-like n=1 Tax=Homarus americanus TaxID=6706 RepID=A0A8J5K1A5_HOMAM|nr:Kunitz-type serine protease inhibitor 3-like [Homarus americanus]